MGYILHRHVFLMILGNGMFLIYYIEGGAIVIEVAITNLPCATLP